MKNRLFLIVMVVFMVVMLGACQDVFTSNAFFWYKADMANMTDAQKISYAKDLLSSGNKEELAAAYEEIKKMLPSTDPEVVVLAAELALASSGIDDAVAEALKQLGGGGGAADPVDAVNAIIGAVDKTNLDEAVDLVAAAESMDGVTLTADQYANAAAAQVLVIIDTVGGAANAGSIPTTDPGLQQAYDWATAAGVDLEGMLGGLDLPE